MCKFSLFVLVTISFTPYLWADTNSQQTGVPNSVDMMVPYCMSVASTARSTDAPNPTSSGTLQQQVLTEFNLTSADWTIVSTSCAALMTQISALAEEARAIQKQRGGTLPSDHINTINNRLTGYLRDTFTVLRGRLSTSGVAALDKYLSTLASNTVTRRIRDEK